MSKYRNKEVKKGWKAQRKFLGFWISIPGQKFFKTQREAQTHLNKWIRRHRKR